MLNLPSSKLALLFSYLKYIHWLQLWIFILLISSIFVKPEIMFFCFCQAKYIMDELKDKNNIELDLSSWREEPVPLPLQHNGYTFFPLPIGLNSVI